MGYVTFGSTKQVQHGAAVRGAVRKRTVHPLVYGGGVP